MRPFSVVINQYLETHCLTLGGRIRFTREALKLSQIDFAKKVGITRVALGKIERNISSPSATTLIKISEVLDVYPESLFPFAKERKD